MIPAIKNDAGSGMVLEVCVDDVAGLREAVAGGADRIELCSALALGGLTPSAGFMAAAAEIGIKHGVEVRAMIRPRAGDFVWSPDDIELMLRDIDTARAAGLAGTVLGASLPGGALDPETLRILCDRSGGLKRTLHRAFDLVPDAFEALETAVALGFDTILSSGCAPTAVEGLDTLTALVKKSTGRIRIMPGSGIKPENAADIVRRTGVRDIHASCPRVKTWPDPKVSALGFAAPSSRTTDRDTVAALKAIIAGL